MFRLVNYYPNYTVYFQPQDIRSILPQLKGSAVDYYALKLHGMRDPIAISTKQFERIEPFLQPGALNLSIDNIDKPLAIDIKN